MNENLEFLKTGTTIVSWIGKDFIVMGSDKRVSAGYSFMGEMPKIKKLNENIMLAMAGTVGDCQEIHNFLKNKIEEFEEEFSEGYYVDEALRLIINILRNNPSRIGFILSGRCRNGELKSYSLDPAGGFVERVICALGSGRSFAISSLEKDYSNKDDLKKATKKIKKAIQIASKLDLASGNGFSIEYLKF